MNYSRNSLERYLHTLEVALAGTSLSEPRPVADMGLNSIQRKRLQRHFSLDPDNLRPAAVLIPIQLTDDSAHIILTQRSEELRHHAGQVSFPGGSREQADNNLAQTALREAHEEIGLDPKQVKILGYLPDYPTVSGFCVTPVVGLVSTGASIRPDDREVTAIHRLPLKQLLGGRCISVKTIEHDRHHYPVKEVKHGGLRIWGATAAMLCMLHDEITVQLAEAPAARALC